LVPSSKTEEFTLTGDLDFAWEERRGAISGESASSAWHDWYDLSACQGQGPKHQGGNLPESVKKIVTTARNGIIL
jgi:hypothetical protein